MSTVFREIPIEELCTKVTSGLTPLRSRSDFYENGTIDWYKTGELNDWYLEPAKERISDRVFKETSIKLFPTDTVLMAMYGDGKTITSMGILRAPAATNQACAAMFVDRKKCHPRYFFYALKSRRELLLKIASGGAQRNLSGKLMKEFQLPIPPLPIQHRIAGILSTYDDLIENSQRRIKILESMARGLYREWFVHFRFPGHENHPRVASAFGEIPQGWVVKKLSEIAILNYGKALKKEDRCDGDFPVFGSSGVVGTHNLALVKGPGIIVGRKGNVGSVFWCDDDFFVIDTAYFVTSSLPLRYLFYVLPTLNFINSDAAVPGLSRNQAYSLDVLVPPQELLVQFCELANTFECQALTLNRQILNLRRTRDLLLPRLLSGQINVEAP